MAKKRVELKTTCGAVEATIELFVDEENLTDQKLQGDLMAVHGELRDACEAHVELDEPVSA